MRPILIALLLLPLTAKAQDGGLLLKRVMLSSGGVGYFEYSASVDGDAILGLDVPLEQIDDVLKSLVVFDASGSIANVELPGRDNTNAAFGDVPFGPEALQSPTDYLNALRGTEVTVQGPRPMTGRLLRAEPVTETIDKTSVKHTRVTLLSGDGLRQFVLEDAETVQVADPVLRDRIGRALEAMRRDSGRSTRHLTLRVKGTGKRVVAAGYVAGAPLWKATYRLVLPSGTETKARMQGWATLENQSGTDWKGVALTLQYGNPVTFRQALYRSYFVQRPEVPVEILGQVLPDIDTKAAAVKAPAEQAADSMKSASAGMVARGFRMAAPMPGAPAPPPMANPAETAVALETGEETIFALAQPVDLAAGHTANVPIIDRAVPASRAGLVPFMQQHPLSAIRVRNDGGESLPAGVLTLYDSAGGNSFAGDARLGGLPTGEARLLSFARDLRTTVETGYANQTDLLKSVTVADGVMTFTVRSRQAIRIAATAPATEPRDLLLEVTKEDGAQTLTPEDPKIKIAEETATAWRVALPLIAGQNRVITLWRDRPVTETIALADGDAAILVSVMGSDKLPPAGRAALQRIIGLRQDLARKEEEAARVTKDTEEVNNDEERIRKNLASVNAADALRGRLTRALDADETKIEQLRKAAADAAAEVEKARRTLTNAIATLKI